MSTLSTSVAANHPLNMTANYLANLATLFARHVPVAVRRTSAEVPADVFSGSELGDRGCPAGQSAIALAARRRFYTARQRQYTSESLPPKTLVAPAVVVGLTLLAWYATIFHYQP